MGWSLTSGRLAAQWIQRDQCVYLTLSVKYVLNGYVHRYSTPLSNSVLTRPGRHGLVPNSRSFHDPLARACDYLIHVYRYSAPLSNPVSTRPGRHGLVPNSRSFHDPLDRACGCNHLLLSFCDECFFLLSFCGMMLRIVTLGSLGIRGWTQTQGRCCRNFLQPKPNSKFRHKGVTSPRRILRVGDRFEEGKHESTKGTWAGPNPQSNRVSKFDSTSRFQIKFQAC